MCQFVAQLPVASRLLDADHITSVKTVTDPQFSLDSDWQACRETPTIWCYIQHYVMIAP
jgi:hypothetical protein